MSTFFTIQSSLVSHLVTDLEWRHHSNIHSNAQYNHAFNVLFEQHTPIGIRSQSGHHVTLGVVNNEKDIVNDHSKSLVLAVALKTAMSNRQKDDADPSASNDALEKDPLNIYITKINPKNLYICAYTYERVLIDTAISMDSIEYIEELIDDLFYEQSVKYLFHLTYIDLSTDEVDSLQKIFNELLINADSFEIGTESRIEETLLDVINPIATNKALFLTNVKVLRKTRQFSMRNVVLLATTLAVGYTGYSTMFATEDTSQRSKSAFQAALEKSKKNKVKQVSPIKKITEIGHDREKDQNVIQQIRQEEQRWLEHFIRQSGNSPFPALKKVIGSIEKDISGYSLERAVYMRKFSPRGNTPPTVHLQYKRNGTHSTINNFLVKHPIETTNVDGSEIIASQKFQISPHERPYIFEPSHVNYLHLVSDIQVLGFNNNIKNWVVGKAPPPLRPMPLSSTERSAFKRVTGGDASDNSFITPMTIYTVSIESQFLNSMSDISQTMKHYPTAVITSMNYDVKTNLLKTEIYIYDFNS